VLNLLSQLSLNLLILETLPQEERALFCKYIIVLFNLPEEALKDVIIECSQILNVCHLEIFSPFPADFLIMLSLFEIIKIFIMRDSMLRFL